MDSAGSPASSPLYNVIISNADVAEDARGRFTVYYVRVMQANAQEHSWLVLRRYRDFRSLRQQLGRRHAKVLKLDFPARRFLGRMSRKVIRERQLALQAFMNEVLCLCPEAPELRFFLDAIRHHAGAEERRQRQGMVVVADAGTGDLLDEVELQRRWEHANNATSRIRLAAALSLLGALSSDTDSTANPEEHIPSVRVDLDPKVKRVADVLQPSDFTVLGTVEQGEFGEVCQVRPVGAPEEAVYAMKRLSKGEIIQQEIMGEDVSEIVLVQGVRHPFVTELHFAFQTDDDIYLVLDYCGGGPLFDHLPYHIFFHEGIVQFYAAQLIVALQFLHSHHLVFRYLTPQNVLLDNHGNLKLTDFALVRSTAVASSGEDPPLATLRPRVAMQGLDLSISGEGSDEADADQAKRAEESLGESERPGSETRSGVFEGSLASPEYLAPEILQGAASALDDEFGPEIDWWALGILVFEMATGAPPFADEEFNELKARIIGGAIQFPPDAPLPFELQYFISGLLEKEPARRLGCTSADVRMHPFFTGLDWEALEERRLAAPEVNLRRSSSMLPVGALDGPSTWCT